MEQNQNSDRDPVQLGSQISEVLTMNNQALARLTVYGAELQLQDALDHQAKVWGKEAQFQEANIAVEAASEYLRKKRAAVSSEQ